MKKPMPYKTEAEMCAAFMARADNYMWKFYPETGGWDFLAVRETDGIQVGFEAKLRPNVTLIRQMVQRMGRVQTPDYAACLIGARNDDLWTIGGALGFGVYFATDADHERGDHIEFHLSMARRLSGPMIEIPKYTSDAIAGSPSPTPLSGWKIMALRAMVAYELNGHVTRADLGAPVKQATSFFYNYLEPASKGARVPGLAVQRAPAHHPSAYAEIRREMEGVAP